MVSSEMYVGAIEAKRLMNGDCAVGVHEAQLARHVHGTVSRFPGSRNERGIDLVAQSLSEVYRLRGSPKLAEV